MPNIITGHNDVLIVLGATNGGWCIYAGTPDNSATEILETAPAAAVSDDEGLIEWFADQLALPTPELQARPPNPGPEAKPAEHGAPPVAGDIGQIAAEHMTAVLTLADVRKALKPFAAHAKDCRDLPDREYLSIQTVPGGYEIVNFGELRTLLRAAGMFTDEMQAPAPNPGPATAAGDTPPSPAAPHSDDSERLDMLDVGDGDDDGDDDSVDP